MFHAGPRSKQQCSGRTGDLFYMFGKRHSHSPVLSLKSLLLKKILVELKPDEMISKTKRNPSLVQGIQGGRRGNKSPQRTRCGGEKGNNDGTAEEKHSDVISKLLRQN